MSRGALRGPGGKEGSSSMMLKGSQVMNPRKLHRKITALQLAGRTDHEIAETLGISPKTVAIHVGRAIQRLRELLAQVR